MNAAELSLALAAGLALGVFYFGGLWFTVVRLAASRHAPLLMVTSYVVRLAVTLAGFFLVMQGRWENLLACLFGFLVARFILLRKLNYLREPVSPLHPHASDDD